MPVPSPTKGESADDFHARCMSAIHNEYETDQANAICFSQWRKHHGQKEAAAESVPMKLYVPFSKVDADQRMCWGYASTEARDDQGEVVKRDALTAALGDYMKFANIREMHQLSAVGTAKEAAVDDKGLYIGAKIIDDRAWQKVREGVYRGYSIGGRVTKRDPADYKTITGLILNEISVVDRPANPEAVFDIYKASNMPLDDAPFNPPIQIWKCDFADHAHIAKSDAIRCKTEARKAAKAAAEAGPVVAEPVKPVGEDPIAKAAEERGAATNEAQDATLAILRRRGEVNIDDEEDVEKKGNEPYGPVKYADPGYQADGKKRYPIDTEAHIRAAWSYINKPKNSGKYSSEHAASIKRRIVSAWKSKIDAAGPPSAGKKKKTSDFATAKSLWDIGELAVMVAQLMHLEERLKIEASMEGDESSMASKAHAACGVMAQFLRDLVAEETAEAMAGTEIDEPVAMAAGAVDEIVGIIKSNITDTSAAEALVEAITKAGARHNATDQAHLDTMRYAIGKAMGLPGVPRAHMVHMGYAHKAVLDAGATNIGADGREMITDGNPTSGGATQHSTTDTGRNPMTTPPNPTGAVPAAGNWGPGKGMVMGKASDPIAYIDAMVKAGKGHVALCNAAHDLLHAVSDGATCMEGAAAPARHSSTDMAIMHAAHSHLMMVDGVQCAGGQPNPIPGGKPAGGEEEGQGTTSSATKIAASANDDLAKALAASPVFIAITDRLEAIGARVEQIAQTPLPPATIARIPQTPVSVSKAALADGRTVDEAIAEMSEEDITRALIKRSHRQPIVMRGVTDGPAAIQPR